MTDTTEQSKEQSYPPPPTGGHGTRLGDRGDASGRNLEQNRAVGQDDPTEGSRTGREANEKEDFPGTPDIGTNAAQNPQAQREKKSEKR